MADTSLARRKEEPPQTAGGRDALVRRDLGELLAGGEIEFGVPGVVADEQPVAADELQVARLRLADGHEPIFGRCVFVHIKQLRETFIDGDKLVLDRCGLQTGGNQAGEEGNPEKRGGRFHGGMRQEKGNAVRFQLKRACRPSRNDTGSTL